MNYKNETMTEYEKYIMILNENGVLNDFKSLLLCDIFYFEHFKGGYVLFKKYLNEKYNEYGNEETLMAEIDDLIEKKYLFKTTKKAIFNSKFITNIHLSINENLATPEKLKLYVNGFLKYGKD